jgi:ribose transport system ATP-binding protein
VHGENRPPAHHAQPCGAPLLEVRGLTHSFGATRALSGVSLQLLPGEIHCVLGENGAGKSTLGKIIAGVHRPDAGEIWLDGRHVQFGSPRDARAVGIAMVYQELSLAPHLSVRANLWLGSEPHRWAFTLLKSRRESRSAHAMARQLGFEGVDLETPVGQLPVSVQQLVEIGKALMCSPRVVVFDEPTAMLGAFEETHLFNVLRQLRVQGVACVMITHQIEDVLAVANRVTIMRNGSVIQSFTMTPELNADAVVERLTGRSARKAGAAPRAVAGEPLLRIEGVSDSLGAARTLALGQGEILGLYGVVGCGAEKILRALAGVSPSRRSLFTFRLAGRPYRPRQAHHARSRGVAYLPPGRASNGVLPNRSIRDNLLLTQLRKLGRLGFVHPKHEQQRSAELLQCADVRLRSDLDPITSLSGGNQQKVILERTVASASTLLLLEEPTVGVDIEAKQQIHQRIRSIAQRGVGVIVLSSDLLETIELCGTVVTMFSGRMIRTYVDPSTRDEPAIVADVLGQRDADGPARDPASPP